MRRCVSSSRRLTWRRVSAALSSSRRLKSFSSMKKNRTSEFLKECNLLLDVERARELRVEVLDFMHDEEPEWARREGVAGRRIWRTGAGLAPLGVEHRAGRRVHARWRR